MASAIQQSILRGVDGFSCDEHKANKLLQNNDVELHFLFPGALHIAQGLVSTAQFMMYFEFNLWLQRWQGYYQKIIIIFSH